MKISPVPQDIRGEYILINNELRLAASFCQLVPDEGIRVYEVLRVMDGVVLFLEDHFVRLQKSLQLTGISFELSLQEFRNRLAGLTVINGMVAGNLRLEIIRNEKEKLLAAWIIPHAYPAADDYSKGVHTALFHAERKNPNAKKVHTGLREQVNAFIHEQGLYEALLVNVQECITEGSRSNFFVIKNDMVFTPTAGEVLEGITRNLLLKLFRKNNIPFREESVPVKSLKHYDAAFLSGTSPKVLPVRSIGEIQYITMHPLLQKIIHLYDEEISNYIKTTR